MELKKQTVANTSLTTWSPSKPNVVESVRTCWRLRKLVRKSLGTWNASNGNNKSKSGNYVSNMASANFHQFTIRPKQVVTVSLIVTFVFPSVFGWLPLKRTSRGLRMRANMR
ncbi:MAG: hypothetical protein ACKPKO_23760, partial [Candidatus Fonsibacter sp.]